MRTRLEAPRWPARLDLLQSGTGVALGLFMWVHMFFVSSILLGRDVMWTVARFFEGYFFFGRPLPWLVSLLVAMVFALFIGHAALALRKFPASYKQYSRLHEHVGAISHQDTTLWYVQVITGFALFFLVPVHLYGVMTQPENIGPYASSDRIWSGRFWILYAPLLVTVHLHAAIGFYRLAMKWGLPTTGDAVRMRRRFKVLMWVILLAFLALGTASLATYMTIGYEHADRAGERYLPPPHTASGEGG